jgi:hypothetical protein
MGMGVMISTLQSREVGFGLPLTEVQMMRVNEARIGQHYKDIDAEKQKLLTDPLVYEYEVHQMKAIGIM